MVSETVSTFDCEMMSKAIQLAQKAIYSCPPNPAVGCVICREGEIIGEGYTRPTGNNHAEIEALMNCSNPKGADVYVTLEPCSHIGRTGACTKALIKAQVKRVFISMIDPNPLVSGKGIEALKDAGIDVVLGLMEETARSINRKFIKFITEGKPWVTVKIAASIDGRTAMESGESKWITSSGSRADVQKIRASHSAIITGIKTILMDNPSLDVRINPEDLQVSDPIKKPCKVVVDSNFSIPNSAKIFETEGEVIIATLRGKQQMEKSKIFSKSNVKVLFFDSNNDQVPIHDLLDELAKLNISSVLVEAGATLTGSFVAGSLIDELVCYFAPKIFGDSALPMFKLPIKNIDSHLALSLKELRHIGSDIRMTFAPDKDY